MFLENLGECVCGVVPFFRVNKCLDKYDEELNQGQRVRHQAGQKLEHQSLSGYNFTTI